jgi:hypothetical protein
MKSRTFVSILILVLAVLIIAGSCATGKRTYVSSEYALNELTGTWYNEEYEDQDWDPTVIINPDGTFEFYKTWVETSKPSLTEVELIEFNYQWTDTKGNVWYKAQFFIETWNYTYFELGKISNSGTVWELVWSNGEYPKEIDTESLNYRVRYRQQ